MHKRNRTIEEKINDCLDNAIKNLHPTFREELYKLLMNVPEVASSVSGSRQYINSIYRLPTTGSHTKNYWIARGWSEHEAKFKCKQSNTRKDSPSPFSLEFWLDKINPVTNEFYTEAEAEYKRNSQRPIRKEYWIERGYCESDAIELAIKTKNSNNKKGNNVATTKDKDCFKYTSPRCKEYYMLREYTEQESLKKVSEYQKTFSLDICIKKYGEKEGKEIWLQRQEIWQKNYKKSNFSKISQKLFWEIYSKLNNKDNIFFAELGKDNTPDLSGKNNELRLKLTKVLLPDFIDTSTKKVIEFDGTYWHGDVGRGNKLRDRERDEILISHGYKVLHISENEYNNDKQMVIEKCLNFLTE